MAVGALTSCTEKGGANGTVHSTGCFLIKGNTFRDNRRFQFNQNFRKFGTSGNNGTEIARKSFEKFRKLVNFRKANHSSENSGKFRELSWMERNLPGKFLSKIWVYIALNFAYHLPKLWTDQFAHVNGSGKWWTTFPDETKKEVKSLDFGNWHFIQYFTKWTICNNICTEVSHGNFIYSAKHTKWTKELWVQN